MYKTIKSYKKLSGAHNSARGQALVESAVGLVLIVSVFVMLIMLGLNVYFATTYGLKAQMVATEAAKVQSENKYWLGMPRPVGTQPGEYDPGVTEQMSRNMAARLSTMLGLPPLSKFSLLDNGDAAEGDIIQVKVDYLCPLPFVGGIFPNAIPVSGTGVAVHPKAPILAAVDIGAPSVNNSTKNCVVRVPAYGFRSYPIGPTMYTATPTLLDGIPNSGVEAIPREFRGLELVSPSAFSGDYKGLDGTHNGGDPLNPGDPSLAR